MKSKPIYAPLSLDPSSKRHLFLIQGAGESAARRALADTPGVDAVVLTLNDSERIESVLDDTLAECGMGTAFYVAGPELFLWQMTNRLRQAGIAPRRIQQELAGSAARNVYCVHCRTMNERVISTLHRCAGCGMALTVRNHFSRPLAAYMGVIVDAESPGDMPEPEVLYV